MNGIEKITEKIIAEARAAAEETAKKARERAAAISLEYTERADAARKELMDAAKAEADAIVSRMSASIETVQRNALLAEQAAIIDETFAEAYNSIRDLPDEKYVSFLAMLASSSLTSGIRDREKNLELYGPDEDSDTPECYEILLCRSDRDKYASPLLEEIRRSVIGRVPPEEVEKLVISEETADIDGGLILRLGSIECNCSLSLMFDRIRSHLEGQVSGLLFNRA